MYGLQLCSKVRIREERAKSTDINMVQKAQKRLLRTLTSTRMVDKIRIKDLQEQTNIMSVNQTAAEIKLI
jgi:hypothetical protein